MHVGPRPACCPPCASLPGHLVGGHLAGRAGGDGRPGHIEVLGQCVCSALRCPGKGVRAAGEAWTCWQLPVLHWLCLCTHPKTRLLLASLHQFNPDNQDVDYARHNFELTQPEGGPAAWHTGAARGMAPASSGWGSFHDTCKSER